MTAIARLKGRPSRDSNLLRLLVDSHIARFLSSSILLKQLQHLLIYNRGQWVNQIILVPRDVWNDCSVGGGTTHFAIFFLLVVHLDLGGCSIKLFANWVFYGCLLWQDSLSHIGRLLECGTDRALMTFVARIKLRSVKLIDNLLATISFRLTCLLTTHVLFLHGL